MKAIGFPAAMPSARRSADLVFLVVVVVHIKSYRTDRRMEHQPGIACEVKSFDILA